MKKISLSITYRNQNQELHTESSSALVEFLECCIHSISSAESVNFNKFLFDGCAVSGLNNALLNRGEVVALKNALNTENELEIYKLLGALHCSDDPESLNIVDLLETESKKVKGVYLSNSDLKAKQQHFDELKRRIVDGLKDVPNIIDIRNKIDWDGIREDYFSKVKMDYFGQAVLFIERS